MSKTRWTLTYLHSVMTSLLIQTNPGPNSPKRELSTCTPGGKNRVASDYISVCSPGVSRGCSWFQPAIATEGPSFIPDIALWLRPLLALTGPFPSPGKTSLNARDHNTEGMGQKCGNPLGSQSCDKKKEKKSRFRFCICRGWGCRIVAVISW